MKNKCIKINILILVFFFTTALFAQTKEPVFISPNNDGNKDDLVIPIKITDSRYISEWNFIIEDEAGSVVRIIGNKEKRPERLTFTSFFKLLFTPKKGVEIPQSVRWNGVLDNGEIAADGTYFYFLSAEDDNGNISKTEKFKVIVDNTSPDIILVEPKESAKIFGAGNKPVIAIEQKGSVEDLWIASMKDSTGTVIRTWKWENDQPTSFSWDGKDSLGIAVPEGVYSYSIMARDKAYNTSEIAKIDNIIYDAIPRSVNLLVKGSPFSPLSDSERKNITVSPSMSTDSGLLKWSISVLNGQGSVEKEWSGTSLSPISFSYDGVKEDGTLLSDGDYKLFFTTSFNNGQIASISRNFTIDTRKPLAHVKTDTSIFSPDGDGNLDIVTVYQEASKEKSWSGFIRDENGLVVKEYIFGDVPPSKITWNGVKDDGSIKDGHFTYELVSFDLAGNKGNAKTKPFELNTGTTEVLVSVSPESFSPNADTIKDEVIFTPIIKTDTGISFYELSIIDENKSVVKVFKDNRSLPASISWNGLATNGIRCSDGMYTASLFIKSKNGSESTVSISSFELDATYPSIVVSTPYVIFSPNGDGSKDVLPIIAKSSHENLWKAFIADKNGTVVKEYSWNESLESFDWDGRDESGNIVSDGLYTCTFTSRDEAGNDARAQLQKIVVDNRATKAYVTAEYDAISSNGDDVFDVQEFSIMMSLKEGVEDWNFSVVDTETKAVVKRWTRENSKVVPSLITWDGLNDEGVIAEGSFRGILKLLYEKGDTVEVETTSFINWITPPQLLVRTSPDFFSPDNDGVSDELFIALSGTSAVPFKSWSFSIHDPNNGNVFFNTSGKALITERMIWDGRGNNGELVQSAMDYPFVFSVTDTLGMTSVAKGFISVDVLVIRVGDVLKMQVPSIIFRSDNADFKSKAEVVNGLDESIIANNNRVLKRISDILKKFQDYDVTIEGHANNISGTELEETEDSIQYGKALVPLSLARAEYVKSTLVGYGVNEMRLNTNGLGGRAPVAARSDKDNWWKNRRVEFILNK